MCCSVALYYVQRQKLMNSYLAGRNNLSVSFKPKDIFLAVRESQVNYASVEQMNEIWLRNLVKLRSSTR